MYQKHSWKSRVTDLMSTLQLSYPETDERIDKIFSLFVDLVYWDMTKNIASQLRVLNSKCYNLSTKPYSNRTLDGSKNDVVHIKR